MKLFKKIFFISFIVFTIFFMGISSYIKNTLTQIQKTDIITYDPEDTTINNTADNNSVNILIAGIASHYLADTIILCNFNPNNKSINFLSIPRDTFYHRDGFNGPSFKKINSSYGVKGNSSIKAQSLISSVSDLLDVNIDHFIKIDFEAVEKSINAIGGVQLNIEEDIYYSDPKSDPPLLINFKKGPQKLNGEDSLKYLRYRDKKRGDLGRIERQQKFIKSFIAQSMNIKVLNILEVVKEHVEITINTEDILYYFTQLYKIEPENIQFTTLPGNPESINKTSFYIHDKLETQKLISNTYR